MRFLTVLLLALIVAGCGFTLRGASLLPESMKQMTLQADDLNSELVEKLENELRRSGVELLPNRPPSAAELRILGDRAEERVLSVSSSGRPKEYELYHTVVFELSVEGAEPFEPVSFTLTRDYFFDEQDILGKTEDASFLRDALTEDVARAIVRRAALLVRERER
jgi:LPS-assembly lipoprotein